MKKILIKQVKKAYLFQISYLKESLFISLLCMLVISCESFLEVDPPQSEITGAIVFKDKTTTTAAISEVYARLREDVVLTGSYEGVGYRLGLYADELDYYGGVNSPSTLLLYNNSLIPSSSIVTSIWSDSYNIIYQINNIVLGIDNSESLDQAFKDQIKGEAIFIRACIHFYLVNLYGDIPYITSPDYRENTIISRMSEDEVYNSIISDLLAAKDLLTDDYVAFEKIRANKGVVSALLARAYLYLEQWENALTESESVINNTSQYGWENDLNNVFLKGSSSAIWQLKPGRNGDNTKEGNIFYISGSPNDNALTSDFINAFEPNDQRFVSWTGSETDGVNTWFYPFKYKERDNTGTTVEYSVVFRLAEQYLIRAEARAQLGDIPGAQEDINKIRNRAGLPDTTASNLNDLISVILQERRVELFTEFGHRFFDLKRFNLTNTVLGTNKPNWDETDALFPIPESELTVNPNLLPQNPGY